MNIQLIDGRFSNQDALELISQLIQVKIKFHERKISNSQTEEDIKYRENKIKHLQRELSDLRQNLQNDGQQTHLHAIINLK